jgi:hypothetical protein
LGVKRKGFQCLVGLVRTRVQQAAGCQSERTRQGNIGVGLDPGFTGVQREVTCVLNGTGAVAGLVSSFFSKPPRYLGA